MHWKHGWAWLLLAVFTAFLAGHLPRSRGPAPAPPYDRARAWSQLELGAESDFDRKIEGLRQVVLDSPPEVGTGYQPQFPADLPFDEKAWRTNRPSPSVAEPTAPQGGELRLAIEDFPPTLRTEGPNSRLKTLSDIHALLYEPLLGYDMVLGDFVPALARWWQVGQDKRTFRFRLDPDARWADGSPVTADDVVATFEHLRNADRKDPAIAEHWNEKLESVRALDRLTVEVKGKRPEWRTMLEVAGQRIYPAAYIRMEGDTYLTEWNWKLPPGSGPYALGQVIGGRSIEVNRRKDYWNRNEPGTYNFATIHWEVIRDEELIYQKFLAGELDVYEVMRAQRWVDEVDQERPVQMGWVQKRKIYELEPQGYGGFAFNMRSAPFNSRNVREAFANLFNRELLFEKFFYFQYDYVDSYFPGQTWAREGHRPVAYNPKRARQLLAADGWTHRDAQGYLVNDAGRRFPTLRLDNASPSLSRAFAAVAHDLWQQAGIKLTIAQIDGASLLKKVWDYKYQLVFWNWTADLFPDMEFQFHSKYANAPQSNNINGFKNAEADRLMEAYKGEFDLEKRKAMMRRLDELLFHEHPYALGWYAPYYRLLYWNRFGHPPEYGDRYTGGANNVIRYWWYNEELDKVTQDQKARGLKHRQEDQVEHRWWLENARPKP